MTKNIDKRFWEIDLLRGIAIIMMIIFHILYDLNYFDICKIDLNADFFLIFFYPFGAVFLLLVGISLTLSYSRAQNTLTKKRLSLKFLMRGLKIFGYGLLITLATWLYLQEGFIIFGVLHCIGLSIILSYPFLRFRVTNLVLGLVFICTGLILKMLTFDFSWFVWLGFKPIQFYTVDYYPLLPWFGVVLIGIFLGNSLYQNNKRTFNLNDYSHLIFVRFFCFLGRHSLIIYLLHQPILVCLVYLLLL